MLLPYTPVKQKTKQVPRDSYLEHRKCVFRRFWGF